MNRLTKAQEDFVNGIISGLSQRQAYYKAYPKSKKWKEKTVDSRASELFAKSEIIGRYQELLKANENKAIITREETERIILEGIEKCLGNKETEIASVVFGEGKEHKLKKFNAVGLGTLIEKLIKLKGWDRAEEKEEEKLEKLISKLDEALNE